MDGLESVCGHNRYSHVTLQGPTLRCAFYIAYVESSPKSKVGGIFSILHMRNLKPKVLACLEAT